MAVSRSAPWSTSIRKQPGCETGFIRIGDGGDLGQGRAVAEEDCIASQTHTRSAPTRSDSFCVWKEFDGSHRSRGTGCGTLISTRSGRCTERSRHWNNPPLRLHSVTIRRRHPAKTSCICISCSQNQKFLSLTTTLKSATRLRAISRGMAWRSQLPRTRRKWTVKSNRKPRI